MSLEILSLKTIINEFHFRKFITLEKEGLQLFTTKLN